MASIAKTVPTPARIGMAVIDVVSFVVFSLLDVLDVVLCFAYRVADFFVESEWKPCYCSSPRAAIATNGGGDILVSGQGESKIVRMMSSSKVQMEDVSDTLYARASRVSEVSSSAVKRLNSHNRRNHAGHNHKKKTGSPGARSSFVVNSTVVEMIHGRMVGQKSQPIPRWSDCDCQLCNSWSSSSSTTLYVKSAGGEGGKAREDVVFIHGFISSSAFWTETLFPNFSKEASSMYRFFAVDLLGFGRSPKPAESLYTLKEHVDMIEKSVLEPHKVKSFHIVAHSLGCILALALAVRHPNSVKSLTLLAPPYFPVPEGEEATQYVMRRVAPRRVWPLITFGASMACWYEHVSRTICLLICKNHRLWEFLIKLVTRNRLRTYLVEGFCCHTHNAAWHTLHNIICGTAGKLDAYLDAVRDRVNCEINIFHGKGDEVIPVECTHDVKRRLRRANVKVMEREDHITIVVGRQKEFARELEEIWGRSRG
ncbi:probable lysophospholipase BODYGUARD 3 isoform X1 [Rhodamnia argentea]|uniref:Probable lysophospholipase BODYGUARD 3 isoform X1 n=1 Tax=Rhodamnia argentea TaxID=178133 RepID=A0A8B8P8V1_9MYRT|nr:probable lysophospholipase BODYGUARD 3 isoform X1 [Rhodamnia argentea]XP_030530374.2 probable lysophospholipase BODYGUARD 3 isoform X1 [Rhodamnia argentea]